MRGVLARWITALAVVSLIVDVSWATHMVFSHMSEVTGSVAAAYASLVGLPAVYFSFFEYFRRRDET